MPVVDIKNFLARPVIVTSGTWIEGAALSTSSSPLQTFLARTDIKEKVRGFSRIRFTANFKIIMNTSPMHYGVLRLCFHPNSSGVTGTRVMTGPTNANTSGSTGDRMVKSLLPGVWISAQDPKPAEFSIPFIWPTNWMSLDSSREDARAFGTLFLQSYVLLKTAGAPTTYPASYQIYCWLTDVELSGPTFVSQSAEDPPVGPPPALLEREHSLVIQEDVVGKTMRFRDQRQWRDQSLSEGLDDTAAVLHAAAGVARAIGMSNTPNLRSVTSHKVTIAPFLASAEISTPVEPLSLNGLGGLLPSVPPFGDKDELNIKSIASKESYVGSFTWAKSQATNSMLYNGYVTPELRAPTFKATSRGTAGYISQMTPMCHLCPMFRKWRGTIRYKFVFNVSRFHRGRVRFAYEPSGVPFGTSIVENLNFTHIIDLSETSEFVVDIPWTRVDEFADVASLGLAQSTNTTFGISVAPTIVYNGATFNGAFSITVLNQLIAPISSGDVDVLVFASCPDLELAIPRDCNFGNVSYYDHFDSQSSDEPSITDTTKVMAIPMTVRPARYDNYMGEDVQSIRALMHRSHFYVALNFPGSAIAGEDRCYLHWPRFPQFYGPTKPLGCGTGGSTSGSTAVYGTGGLHRLKAITYLTFPADNYHFNFVYTNPITWMTPCFVGHRGSIVWKFALSKPTNIETNYVAAIAVTKSALDPFTPFRAGYSGTDSSSVMAELEMANDSGSSGGRAIATAGSTLEIQVPATVTHKWLPTCVDQTKAFWNGDDGNPELTKDGMEIMLDLWDLNTASTVNDFGVRTFVQTGTDFNLLGYLYPPAAFITRSVSDLASAPDPNY